MKCAPLAGFALDGHFTTVNLGYMFDNRQPKSRASQLATAPPIHDVEPFEEPRHVFFANTPSFILHSNDHFILVASRRNMDRFVRLAVLDPVIYEIEHRLLHEGGIHRHRYTILATQINMNVLLFSLCLEQIDRCSQHRL